MSCRQSLVVGCLPVPKACWGSRMIFCGSEVCTRRGLQGWMVIEGMGLTVIYIDEDDALRNALYYVQEAIRGIDHSRGAE